MIVGLGVPDARTSTLCVLAMVLVDRVWASLLSVRPAGLVPSVTDQELADFIRDDLRARWRPVTGKPYLWLRDMWVDLGLLTLARASVALDQGRLITKREALDVLAGVGAPRDVLADIHRRRYGAERPISIRWRIKRGYLARAFVRAGIDQILSREQER